MDMFSAGYSILIAHSDTVSLVLGIASAVVGGIFFAFSSFVMTALGKLAPAEGIRAMQRINVDVFSWSFMLLFLGLPVLFLVVAALTFMNLGEPLAGRLLLAALVYLIGVFGVTMFGNVPLNNALARVDGNLGNGGEAGGVWSHYLAVWVRWNHVRMVACVVVAAVLLF